jgi:hypothetical protein
MEVTFPEYMLNIQRDFVAFVAAESVAFRSLGTNKRAQRVRMIEMVLMKGAYAALEAYDYTETDPMWTQDEVDDFVDILNDVMGLDYEISWLDGIWRDDDDGGVWYDNVDGGTWFDNN